MTPFSLLLDKLPSSLSFKCALRENGCRIGYEPTKNESRSLSAVYIQRHQHGGSCIWRSIPSSPSLSLNFAFRESGCGVGYEPTKNELRSLSAVDVQGHQRGGFCIVPLDKLTLLNGLPCLNMTSCGAM